MFVCVADAFSDRPFSGNPAAVCFPDRDLPDIALQQIAAEIHLSETAFLYRADEATFRIRWFTPKSEVDLCGHATLASAHVLWETKKCRGDRIQFLSKSGHLFAQKKGDVIQLDFPSEVPVPVDKLPNRLAEGVDVPIRSVYRSRLDYLVETDDEQSVLNASPDERLISRLDGRGLIISSASSREGVDFVSRCFYPKLGVYEDPVTGSAHCQLLPYWHRKTGHTVFVAEQLSERRGKLFLQLSGDRCLIGGQAVTVIRGSMLEHILK